MFHSFAKIEQLKSENESHVAPTPSNVNQTEEYENFHLLVSENYTMRAGSHCIIFPLANHLDPTWGPDSDQFRPERWLDGDFRNNKEFAAFALGKRACIGTNCNL